MADEQGNKSICLLGTHVHFLRLFGVHIPIPKVDTTSKDPKKRSLIKTEPIFFDDDDDHHDESMLNKEKTNHHENLGVINAEPVGWLDPLASTPIYHFVPVDPACHVLWNFITTTVGGEKIEVIIQKSLQKTDLDGHQARLSMPKSHILREFLTKQEEDLLEGGQRLSAMVIDPCLRPFELSLAKWKYHKKINNNGNNEGHSDDQSRRSSYVLISGWNKLREANSSSLTVSVVIQVWSFRGFVFTLKECSCK
ncbi:hypothetical protein Cgig2_023727 [Carnegiea gigantea]|uniref:TF-B3 domain-containing protein n=1 Tax=Carnegiea gigantea TaxID=171969 RepID=A0A9Q1KJI5_9CARY|nr:hypothetical protein Cgig2_023727 [Carnegiea gigantea]